MSHADTAMLIAVIAAWGTLLTVVALNCTSRIVDAIEHQLDGEPDGPDEPEEGEEWKRGGG